MCVESSSPLSLIGVGMVHYRVLVGVKPKYMNKGI
jgi:hypothetical protein